MDPRHGEVWLADLGIAGKTRPVVVLLADNVSASRTLIIYVPVTRQSRGGELEVSLGNVAFLDSNSLANVQAIGAAPRVRFERRLGTLSPPDLLAIKRALIKACAIVL